MVKPYSTNKQTNKQTILQKSLLQLSCHAFHYLTTVGTPQHMTTCCNMPEVTLRSSLNCQIQFTHLNHYLTSFSVLFDTVGLSFLLKTSFFLDVHHIILCWFFPPYLWDYSFSVSFGGFSYSHKPMNDIVSMGSVLKTPLLSFHSFPLG